MAVLELFLNINQATQYTRVSAATSKKYLKVSEKLMQFIAIVKLLKNSISLVSPIRRSFRS